MALWSKLAGAFRRAVPVVVRDGVGIAGAGLVSYGAWLIYQPAGYITAGGFLLAAAWLWAKAPA